MSSTKDKRAIMRAQKYASSGGPVPKGDAWQVWTKDAKDKYPEEYAKYTTSANSMRGSLVKFAALMREAHEEDYQTYIDTYGKRAPPEAVSSSSAASITITESPVEEIVSRISALQEELDRIKELCMGMKGGSRKNFKTRKLRS